MRRRHPRAFDARRGRRTHVALLLTGLVGASVLVAGPSAAEETDWRVVVTFVAGTGRVGAERTAETVTGEAATAVGPTDVVVIADAAEVGSLLARPDVVAVVEDGPAFAAEVPNDPCLFNGAPCGQSVGQSGLLRIGGPLAWDITAPHPVSVALIDAGVDTGHPDLAGRVTLVQPGPGGCLGITTLGIGTADDTDISHGTMVAGVIAAATGNGTGVAGVVRAPLTLLSYKVLRQSGGSISGSTADVAGAVNCAVDAGVDVINLSLTATDQPALRNAIDRAVAAGIVVVAAAGNGGNPASSGVVPGAYPGVVAVAATDGADHRASFSNGGGWVDLAAPGTEILSTARSSAYRVLNGTSFSTPFVSGAAAQLLGREAGMTPDAVVARLQATAVPLGDGSLGAGRLDYATAVRFPAAGAPACRDVAAPGWLLDGWGGVHEMGGAPHVLSTGYWPGWDIANDLTTAGGLPGGYVLDGFGGLHPLEGTPVLAGGPYWFGWDIARAAARRPDGQGVYVLDGFGGVHLAPAAGAAPVKGPGGPYWFGWDIARDIAVDPTDSTRGFVLDGFGGVHTFGFPADPGIRGTAYSHTDNARALVVLADGSGGYVIDESGRARPFAVGTRPMPPEVLPSTLPFADSGRAMALDGGGKPTVVSPYGTAMPTGAIPCHPAGMFGFDIVRAYTSAP